MNNGKYPTQLTASFITNNVKVRFTLDSGAEVNTINKKFVPSKLIMPTHKKLTMWNGTRLVPLGQCLISLYNPKNGENHKVHFIVVDNSLDNLLGAETLSRLNLITVNKENFVGNVTSTDNTSKVMKLGDLGTAKLYVDPKVQPKVLPCRRIPESKHDKVCQKLQQMIDHDILGHVDHPTDWVSQMCCVERADRDDIRICIDPGPLGQALDLGSGLGIDRVDIGIIGNNQRPNECCPVAQKMEDGKSRQSWNYKRHRDTPPDGELGPAVNPSSFDQLIRQAHEKLPHQECAKTCHQPREGDPPIGVDPAKTAGHHVPGDDQHFSWDHQRAENGDEDDLATAKIKLS